MNLCVFYSYRVIGKLTFFYAVSRVQFLEDDRGMSLFHRVVLSYQLKSKIGNILVKDVVLRVNLNLDGTTITS